MKRQAALIRFATIFLAAVGMLAVSTNAWGQFMAEYEAHPPFLETSENSEDYPPNILILLDNSDSLNQKAYSGAFDPSQTYVGLFNPMKCYQVGGNDVFEYDSTDKSSVSDTCSGTYEWDGNLLNWASMRRIDIVKWVLVGGKCSTTRSSYAPLHECQSGYLEGQGQQQFMFGSNLDWTQSVPAADASGRVDPLSGNPDPLYFHVVGSDSSLYGKVCLSGIATTPPKDSDCLATGEDLREIRVQPPPAADDRGIIQEIFEQARFGLMEFNDPAFTGPTDGGRVIRHVDWKKDGDIGPLIDDITQVVPQAESQPAEGLYEAARYFAQISPEYDVNDYKDDDQEFDPFWFTTDWITPAQYVPCCKSFVLLITDGEPTADTNIPVALQDYHSTSYGYVDDVALWAHTTDLRQDTIPVIGDAGNNLAGEQNVTLYTVFAFGTGGATLKEASKAGGFNDSNGNDQPDLQSEWDTIVNTTGAAGQDGVPDTYFEAPSPKELKDQMLLAIQRILQKTASGSAASVMASSSTGEGAVYQSFFFPTVEEGNREVKWVGYVQGLFLDAFGNLREDNGDARLVYEDDMIVRMNFNGATGDINVERFIDSDGNGLADSGTPSGVVTLETVGSIWEAGTELATTDPCDRKIQTWVDKNTDGRVDVGEQIEFSVDDPTCTGETDNTAWLAPYLRPSAAPFTAANIVKFIRGQNIAGMRDRDLTVNSNVEVWKLSDSVYATPVVVGGPSQRYDIIYGDASYTAFLNQYKGRRQVAYVGANDGMLHAFNAGYYHRGDDPSTGSAFEHGWFTRTPTDNSSGPALGEELFGFIPQELLPHLKWLTDPSYTHVYYVDLTPKVTDARIFTPDADHPNGWGTILMGGFRLGGSCGLCTGANGAPPMQVTGDFDNNGGTPDTTRTFYSAYFVLDVTNPESTGFPKLLFSYADSTMGLTTNVPSMLRVNPSGDSITSDTNAMWYMLFSSGPTGYDGSIAQAGSLYALDMTLGSGTRGSVTRMEGEPLQSFMSSTLVIDRDYDYRVDVAYVGSTIHDGSLPWRGKIYRMTMNSCAAPPCTSANWGIPLGGIRQTTELLDTFPDGAAPELELGPVTASPGVAIDEANKLWVFAGSGRYFADSDEANTDQQYFVGVKDTVLNGLCTQSGRTNCHENELVDVSSAQVCILGVGNCGSVGNDQVTGVTGATDFPSLIGLVASNDGWYTTLPGTGERALARPAIFGGLVLFPTFLPGIDASDPCSVSLGTSTMYALYYRTGSGYNSDVIGTTDGSGGKKYVNRSTSLGAGLASQAVVHVGHNSSNGRATAFVKKSTAELFRIEIDSVGAITSRLLTWLLHTN